MRKLEYTELRSEIHKVFYDFLKHEMEIKQKSNEFNFKYLESCTDDILRLIRNQTGLEENNIEQPVVLFDDSPREKEGYSSAFCQCGRILRIKTPRYRRFYDLKCPICGFTVKLYTGEI